MHSLRDLDSDISKAAFNIAVRPDQQDDFKQEGLIAAHRAIRRYGDRLNGDELRRVVMRSAVNAMRSWQRKMIRFEAAAVEMPTRTVEQPVARAEVLETAVQVIGEMPGDSHRLCASLFCASFGEATLTEIAALSSCSRATASRAVSAFCGEFRRRWRSEVDSGRAPLQQV